MALHFFWTNSDHDSRCVRKSRELFDIGMFRKFCKEQFQIVIHPEMFRFCGFDQAVHDGAGLGTAEGVHVGSVFAAMGEGKDGLLGRIVVHGDIPVGKEDAKELFLVDAVLQPFAVSRFLREFFDLSFVHAKKSSTFGFTTIIRCFSRFLLLKSFIWLSRW